MKVFALMSVICTLISVYSQDDFTQQITLSCPVNPESNRGPAGVPGKRGSKGEPGFRGK